MQNKIEKVLEDQLCFLLYASSREMTKKYKPLLDKLEVTYPQYLVLLLLWEQDTLTVKKLGELLALDSGTLTPMLKRMEQNGLIVRERSTEDERSVMIKLTEKGLGLQEDACFIPDRISAMSGEDKKVVEDLKASLLQLLKTLQEF
ncbi:MarR family winged helix-turn-helix transcriptional regulator [Peribacillus castrilensis]|jgi:DNA-binding MarR family transcriptional regulator|uniref:MarR family transcriptional regulator n=2 Tax=Peribacillus TaxID=2675229 RepID=A0AAJ1VCA1_9BACI|nr:MULTISPECIES: MarR family transcriptional regulator [Bacillaceae]MBL3642095.1 MarR family transcriptional regulator [Bacillus sp. RHFB]MCD1163607.1 MarR family transcriptional regulator [Peribacillus castrilensis]MCP1094832.1 MarR family transcriptional regulator [Bacillaceae bacterium OS4b]TDL93019.1 MarR family transcriptional regulator [Vibrio vulnificus]CRH88679.1 Organic hydroperoxide resistance transcriptional regulator [Chlamydia trachomatis]